MSFSRPVTFGLAAMTGVLLAGSVYAGPESVGYPEGYQDNFRHYATVNREDDRKQVVKIFANDTALASAADGAPLDPGSVIAMEVYKAELDADEQPVMGDDGFFVPGELAAIAVMESGEGFGADYPDELRNGTWEYALFKGDGSRIERETTACFECHKPLHDADYVFTFEQLQAEAGN